MAIGPGKYDDLATLVRERALAEGVLLIVFVVAAPDGIVGLVRKGITWWRR